MIFGERIEKNFLGNEIPFEKNRSQSSSLAVLTLETQCLGEGVLGELALRQKHFSDLRPQRLHSMRFIDTHPMYIFAPFSSLRKSCQLLTIAHKKGSKGACLLGDPGRGNGRDSLEKTELWGGPDEGRVDRSRTCRPVDSRSSMHSARLSFAGKPCPWSALRELLRSSRVAGRIP